MAKQGFIVHTVCSVDLPRNGTFALVSTVAESERSLREHLNAFDQEPNSPKCLASAFGPRDELGRYRRYRWTWERLDADGTRSTDTVWATRV